MLLTSIWCVRCKWQLLTSPSGSVWRCEGLRAASHGPSDLRAWCKGTDPHPELQTAGCRWAKWVHLDEFALWKKKKIATRSCSFALYLERVLGACLCVKPLFSELKELNSSLTTDEMMSEIQELKTECAGHRARLEKIKSATNHVTPAEKEKVRGFTCVGNISDTLLTHCRWVLSCHFNTQVYREREVYVKEWRKRKRLVMLRGH